jgi:hypothetical protein
MGFTIMLVTMGCSSGDESVIRDGLTKEFDQYRDPTSNAAVAVSGGLSAEITAAWLDAYDFEIGEITIDGNSANVDVTVTNKQLYPAVRDAREKLLEEDTTSLTDAAYEARSNELLIEELEASQPVSSKFVIPCEKNDSTWSMSDVGLNAYRDAMMGSE